VEGSGTPAGTDLALALSKVGGGCTNAPATDRQDLYLRYGGAAGQFHTSDGAGCGLAITAFPTKVGDDASGSFSGVVSGINDAQGTTRRVDLKFSVRRTR